ncbi:MAG: capsule biosynthesis protein [Pseudomonadota bacterium]
MSFLLLVVLPSALTGWYLWTRAVDQYASYVGFSVRQEDMSSPLDILQGMGDISGSSSSDTDILYEFLQSQRLVADLDAEIGLREIWGKPEQDPIFSFDPSGSIEDLVDYWERMVTIDDGGTGLIDVRVLAFEPADATLIAERLFARSSEMINELSAIAQEDTVRYAREDLQEAETRLTESRTALTRFRNANQMVDPAADLESQAGLLGGLQAQLVEALIQLDLLQEQTRTSDPRIAQAERRIEVIEARIAEERRKLGLGSGEDGEEAYADLVGEFERLAIEREIAEKMYAAALSSFDGARADARRQTRYLAAHVAPTMAETARFPKRISLWLLVTIGLGLAWSIMVLVGYSLRDRR